MSAMTTVKIFQNENGRYTGFTCRGHSGFAEKGEDIVCASVSALVINTVNAIETFTDDRCEDSADEEHAEIRFTLDPDYSHDTDLLIRTMIMGLRDIKKSWKANLQILFEEV